MKKIQSLVSYAYLVDRNSLLFPIFGEELKKGKAGVLSICGDCAAHFEKKLAEKDALVSMAWYTRVP